MSQPTEPHTHSRSKRSSADPSDPLAPHQPGELGPARAPNPGVDDETDRIDDADVISSEDLDAEQAPETD